MDTDTIDRLFLELSQFTNAETGKELGYKAALERIRDHAVHSEPLGACESMREIARDALKRAQYR